MTTTTVHKQHTAEPILPEDVNQALRLLIIVSRDLLRFANDEAQALVTMDHIKFAFAQKDKERLGNHYAQACEEFRLRLDEFRQADKALIGQLNALQNELKEKTENNNSIIAQIKKRAEANTQTTLFTAQQMGQRLHMQDNKALNGKGAV